MIVRALSPADRPTPLAGPMQLPQPIPEIPELGGLLSSRLSALAEQGLTARREIDARLGRARRRARGLAVLRGFALFAAGAVMAVCAGALLGSFAPAVVARGGAAVLLLLAGALIVAGMFPRAAPGRLALGLSRLRGGDAAAPPPELSPIVGDLTITYLYPQYTGLPARTEEGTAGDLRAPRGTEAHIT